MTQIDHRIEPGAEKVRGRHRKPALQIFQKVNAIALETRGFGKAPRALSPRRERDGLIVQGRLHKLWILKLATDLREHGVDATLDQWDLAPGQDVAAFMQKGILEADRVLLVCSDSYVNKAETGTGGVGYERLIVTGEVVQNIDTRKFIPLVRANPGEPRIPRFLGPRLYIDFSDDANYKEKREELLRELLGAPLARKPPLGINPFSGALPKTSEPTWVVGPTVGSQTVGGGTRFDRAGGQLLEEQWFEAARAVAEKGIAQLGLNGCMELRFGLHEEISKSQLELLNAVRKSQINTFGWPIGVTLENQDEYKPRPYGDGIRAEISITKESPSGQQSYDYWAARRNGDFYLLQSLFEDKRGESLLFFNTRIIRVAEALMFAANFYTKLGAPPDATLSVRVSHRGLAGRALTSAGGNRPIFPRVSHESTSESEIVLSLGRMQETRIDDVRRITEPLFMLFEFQEFGEAVYTDIVQRFEKGETS
ncbi:MAG: toll/interleukin-1 receptor domain-containing protein [Zoogloea sp.]|nr:toll/interleukin-1 receptor domain-containing protein [Zoogloea sp.]NUN62606.1 toll/interleukin-1 receptor domain-containing protein [Burkholderiaceae bacterium]